MFLAYELDPESRARLLQTFPPKYSDVICHHVTIRYPARKSDALPDLPSLCEVVGYADSGDGVEVLVVSIDGQVVRPDGKYFHITHSLDREAGKKPLHSNGVLENGFQFLSASERFDSVPRIIR